MDSGELLDSTMVNLVTFLTILFLTVLSAWLVKKYGHVAEHLFSSLMVEVGGHIASASFELSDLVSDGIAWYMVQADKKLEPYHWMYTTLTTVAMGVGVVACFFKYRTAWTAVREKMGTKSRSSFSAADSVTKAYADKEMQIGVINRSIRIACYTLVVCAAEDIPLAVMNTIILRSETEDAVEEAEPENKAAWRTLEFLQVSLIMNLLMCGMKGYYLAVLADLYAQRASCQEDLTNIAAARDKITALESSEIDRRSRHTGDQPEHPRHAGQTAANKEGLTEQKQTKEEKSEREQTKEERPEREEKNQAKLSQVVPAEP